MNWNKNLAKLALVVFYDVIINSVFFIIINLKQNTKVKIGLAISEQYVKSKRLNCNIVCPLVRTLQF